MSTHHFLRQRDTRPVLRFPLKNADGSAFNATGTTVWKLHIMLPNGAVITRDLVPEGALSTGVFTYTPLVADWSAGGLAVGVHYMEQEVLAGSARQSFPIDDYDVLNIKADLGQAADVPEPPPSADSGWVEFWGPPYYSQAPG